MLFTVEFFTGVTKPLGEIVRVLSFKIVLTYCEKTVLVTEKNSENLIMKAQNLKKNQIARMSSAVELLISQTILLNKEVWA